MSEMRPPGRERDIAIAKALGWTIEADKDGWYRWVDEKGKPYFGSLSKRRANAEAKVPMWSTVYPLALLAVMEARDYGWTMERDRQGADVLVKFWREFFLCGRAEAPTIAAAASEAALRALAAEKERGE